MKYYVYILVNEAKSKTYVGSTANLKRRLKEHNSGKVKSSKPYCPYKVLHYEEFSTLKEARDREKYFKGTIGRRELKNLFRNGI